MSLTKGIISAPLKQFIVNLNSKEQKDRDAAIDAFCTKLEQVIVDAIKKSTIVIPSGTIMVQGSPSAQTNVAPIILNNVIK